MFDDGNERFGKKRLLDGRDHIFQFGRGPRHPDPARTARVLRTIGVLFRNFSVIARREAELRAELARLPDLVVTIPELEGDIVDLTGLAAIGEHLLR